jgi:hypothetical protein
LLRRYPAGRTVSGMAQAPSAINQRQWAKMQRDWEQWPLIGS